MRGRTVMWTCSTCAFPAMTWACRISLCRRTWKRSSAGLLTLSRRRACTGSSGIRSSPTRRSCMRRDELYVADLVDNTRAIREYLDGISREQWDQDRVRRDAVVYRLLLLGETASALPDILRDRYPDVAWRQIRAFRNLAVHKTTRSGRPGLQGSGMQR